VIQLAPQSGRHALGPLESACRIVHSESSALAGDSAKSAALIKRDFSQLQMLARIARLEGCPRSQVYAAHVWPVGHLKQLLRLIRDLNLYR
jgi:hypothetical protein